jgi:hypothetical protein
MNVHINVHVHEKIETLKREIYQTTLKLNDLKRELRKNEQSLYQQCQHSWVADQNVMSEHTQYVCQLCGGHCT